LGPDNQLQSRVAGDVPEEPSLLLLLLPLLLLPQAITTAAEKEHEMKTRVARMTSPSRVQHTG
jgi:hypothetical protein